jgi:hypothetical protein
MISGGLTTLIHLRCLSFRNRNDRIVVENYLIIMQRPRTQPASVDRYLLQLPKTFTAFETLFILWTWRTGNHAYDSSFSPIQE